MGNKNSTSNPPPQQQEPPPPPTTSATTQQEDDFQDLIDQASTISSKPVGAAERQLLMVLETFSLLDHPEMFITTNHCGASSTSSSRLPNSKTTTTTTFSETFKWSVLSMLRSCGTCEKKHTRHCPLQRQALILPPFRQPVAPCGVRFEHPLQEAFADVIDESALRFICDDCLNNLHITRREALQVEVKKVTERTRGFAGGTLNIDIVDGPSVCGRNFDFNNRDRETEPTSGISRVQNNLVLSSSNSSSSESKKSAVEEDQLCVNGVALSGSSTTDDTLCSVLMNPDLKRLHVTFPSSRDRFPFGSQPQQPQTQHQQQQLGYFPERIFKNQAKYPGLRSVEELTITGYGSLTTGTNNDDTFPFCLMSNLQSLSVSGFSLSKQDFTKVLQGLMNTSNNNNSNINNNRPGCSLLQNVILINQTQIFLDDVLETIGQLPLNLLSVANMKVRTRNDEDTTTTLTTISGNKTKAEEIAHQQQQPPPILVSQLIMWGSNVDSQWLAVNLLPRTQLMTLIDISSTETCIIQFLDACAASNLAMLRVVRANNCSVSHSTSSSSSSSSSTSNAILLHQSGIRKQISTWENLVSLSQLQLFKFVISTAAAYDEASQKKFPTLPSLTSINISFNSSTFEDWFVSHNVLGSLKVLQTLSLHSTSRPQNYGGVAPVPPRGKAGSLSSSSSSSSSLVIRSLRRLHIQNSPPFRFAFNGAPELIECTFGGSQHAASLADFMQLGLGQNVEVLHFASHTGNAASAPSFDLPLASFPRLRSLSIYDSDYCTRSTLSALSSCVNLTKLVIDLGDLPTRGMQSMTHKIVLEEALAGMMSLVELDLSNGDFLLSNFTGLMKGSATSFIVFPHLKKFWKREPESRSSLSSTTARLPIVVDSGSYNGKLLQFLSKQPVLEEIDVENSQLDPDQLFEFWTSECMRNFVTYLNIGSALSPSSSISTVLTKNFSDFNKIPSPSKLRVLKWRTDWCEKEIQQTLLRLQSLRVLEIPRIATSEEDDKKTNRQWGYKNFVEILMKKGVQIRNGLGHTFVKSY